VSSQESSSGGAATAAGIGYEARLAAWYAARIVAEDDALPFKLAAGCRLTEIRCQTGEPVDDLLVGSSDGGWLFIQAKRSIRLSSRSNSEFARVIDQVVRQSLAHETRQDVPSSPWDRPLDEVRDRIVLACGPTASRSIRESLRDVLNWFREIGDASQVDTSSRNQRERTALDTTIAHIKHSWNSLCGEAPSSDEFGRILRVLWVDTRAVEPGETDETTTLQLIRSAVVAEGVQAGNVLLHSK
jgi:hypothetical protein